MATRASGAGGAANILSIPLTRPDHPRLVELNAALAVGGGLDPALAEAALTRRAAELLGLGDRLGRAPGQTEGGAQGSGHGLLQPLARCLEP